MKVLITQSNYIPWKGYFDNINQADKLVIYDEVQYTKRDWRNRNLIKTADGIKWITIPVSVKGKFKQSISKTEIANPEWAKKHWKKIYFNYHRAPYFNDYHDLFSEIYLNINETFLSKINYIFIKTICNILNIKTEILWSDDFITEGDKNQKLIGLIKQLGADTYLTGYSAINYLDEKLFKDNKIKLEYSTYTEYPEYNQLFGPFEHNVSILDLIFNEGKNAAKFMKSL
jgi:hypothetical protein